MSELRWILLAAGVVLLIGIYLFSRRSPGPTQDVTLRREPSLKHREEVRGNLAETETPEPVETVQPPDSASVYSQSDLPLSEESRPVPPAPVQTGEERIVAIHLAARGSRRFRGPDLVAALQAESLEFGDLGIFHRRTGNRSIFSVSSMVEPGHFDLETIEDYTTPGLSFFMVMPGPESPVAAFTEMLSTARRVATVLDGEVLDESGSTLSRQAASHMREQIIEFAHRVR